MLLLHTHIYVYILSSPHPPQIHEVLNKYETGSETKGCCGNGNIYIYFNNIRRLDFFLYVVNKCQNSPLKRGLVSCKYQVHVKRADSSDYFFSPLSVSEALLRPRGLVSSWLGWKCWICSSEHLMGAREALTRCPPRGVTLCASQR